MKEVTAVATNHATRDAGFASNTILKRSAEAESQRAVPELAAGFRMHDAMKLAPPILRIRELERTLAFYENVMGLQVTRRHREAQDGLEVLELGFNDAEEQLLVLKDDSNATPTPHNFAGLYHFAILVPDRKSLAFAYAAVQEAGARFEGFADHLVSESLYLHDPERNGIEIYRDRPRSDWRRDSRGQLLMDTLPLDLESLSAEIAGEAVPPGAFPKGARIGHMHLRVTNLAKSVWFYQEELGLDVMVNLSAMGAAFLSAGGYHHHIGLNTWHSLGGSLHRPGEAGLDELTVIVPDRSFLGVLAARLPRAASQANGRLVIADPDGLRIGVETAPRRAGQLN